MTRIPKINVCVITFNHEKYIAKALESVLKQNGNFELNVLVGEDGSTDNTASIVREFADKNPENITAFYHDPDDKIIINGKKSERKNFINNLMHSNGDYIALLDGDDYWTDDKKLQKQIDFLENNNTFVGCCHKVSCVDAAGNDLEMFLQHDTGTLGFQDFNLLDILKKNPIPSLSVVFRNPRMSTFPPWFYKTYMADWPLHIINAQRGKFRYFDDVMGAYRIHGAGAWSEHRDNAALVLEAEVSVWELIVKDPEFSKYHEYIIELLKINYMSLHKKYMREKKFKKSMEYVSMFENINSERVSVWVIKARMRIFRKRIKWKISEIIKKFLSAT